MKSSVTFILTVLLVLQIPTALCARWWSIVAESNVFNPTDKKTPIHLQCSSFAHILNEEQMGLCRQQSKVLSTSAIGVLQALNQCQKVFKDRPWNCSVFNSSTHYLGRFIDNCTRETAFLNAMISGGISREVARKCKEQELPECGCDFSVDSSINSEDGNTIIGGCGDNCDYGVKIAKMFTDIKCPRKDDCCCSVTLHNNKVGRESVKDMAKVSCLCHGVSGSCSVQTCFKRAPDIDQLAKTLQEKFDIAKKVKIENGVLVPSPKKNELAYCEYSPNFCKRDLPNGIYGTSGRRCYPDTNGYTNCASMCCGRPAIQKNVTVPEERNKCCKFIWCCYLDCSECTDTYQTWYYCK